MRLTDEEMRRLYWHCRRGMLELDLILIPFLKECVPSLSAEDQELFAAILGEPDTDLYNWLMGAEVPAEHRFVNLIQKMRIHASTPS